MVDRVVIGKKNDTEEDEAGLWVSKPGANVQAFLGEQMPGGDWYSYQEEFDFTGLAGSETWNVNDPGISPPHPMLGPRADYYSGGDDAYGRKLGKVKRSPQGTLLYTGGAGDQVLRFPTFVKANTEQVALGGDGFDNIGNPYPGELSSSSFSGLGTNGYKIVEMRLRRLYAPNHPISAGSTDMQLFWTSFPLGVPNPHAPAGGWFEPEGATGSHNPDKVDGAPVAWSGYKSVFPDEEISAENPESEYRILEWDMSDEPWWGDTGSIPGAGGSVEYNQRIFSMRFDFTGSFWYQNPGGTISTTIDPGALWDPETHPMWEIDYVRVKKSGVPAGAGRENSMLASMLFDSDWQHSGLVVQEGKVVIGTQKALMDGTTSNKAVGHTVKDDNKGIVTFAEPLSYIPLVIIQRLDVTGEGEPVGISYPGGESEFSICTTHWEDHRYPTFDQSTTESILHKGFDVKTLPYNVNAAAYHAFNVDSSGTTFRNNGPVYWPIVPDRTSFMWDSSPKTQHSLLYGDATVSSPSTAAAIGSVGGNIDTMSNFLAEPVNFNTASSPRITSTASPDKYSPDPSTYDFGHNHSLPWTGSGGGSFPSESNRAGRKFLDMVESFSEARTFAYTRASKTGFSITCRNAIAQDGMEPALNLAPVLPSLTTANQGSRAFFGMVSNNDNGAWGMFHPALGLYDVGDGNGPQKFTEGLQLKWDTRMTANTLLIDKVGHSSDHGRPGPAAPGGLASPNYSWGSSFYQYQWRPEFSCSGLVFSGSGAKPHGPAPTDGYVFPAIHSGVYGHQYGIPQFTYWGSQSGSDFNFGVPSSFHTSLVNNSAVGGILVGDTGGFYPYRFQKGIHITYKLEDSSNYANAVINWTYNIKRLSSQGIQHPLGVVPKGGTSWSNRNAEFPSTITPGDYNVLNQSSYIGGSANKMTIHTDDPTYAVLRGSSEILRFPFHEAPNNVSAEPGYFRISPNGKWLIRWSGGISVRHNNLQILDAKTGELISNVWPRNLGTLANEPKITLASWSPDGTRILFTLAEHMDNQGNVRGESLRSITVNPDDPSGAGNQIQDEIMVSEGAAHFPMAETVSLPAGTHTIRYNQVEWNTPGTKIIIRAQPVRGGFPTTFWGYRMYELYLDQTDVRFSPVGTTGTLSGPIITGALSIGILNRIVVADSWYDSDTANHLELLGESAGLYFTELRRHPTENKMIFSGQYLNNGNKEEAISVVTFASAAYAGVGLTSAATVELINSAPVPAPNSGGGVWGYLHPVWTYDGKYILACHGYQDLNKMGGWFQNEDIVIMGSDGSGTTVLRTRTSHSTGNDDRPVSLIETFPNSPKYEFLTLERPDYGNPGHSIGTGDAWPPRAHQVWSGAAADFGGLGDLPEIVKYEGIIFPSAKYDPTIAKPPQYKYWVLAVPVGYS
jgi:hypothetical protein